MAAAPGNVMRWKKLVVRDLPHDASCEEVLAVCGFPIVYTDSALRTPIYPPTFFRWEAGKPAKNGRTSVPSRLTLQFRKDPDQLEDTLRLLHGKEVTLANGSTIVLSVHVAPNQRLPREKPRRRDNKSNTIAKDPDFIAFLEELNDPDKKSLAVNNPNILDAGDDKIKEKPVSALVKFLNERRAERRDKNGKVGQRGTATGFPAETRGSKNKKADGKKSGKEKRKDDGRTPREPRSKKAKDKQQRNAPRSAAVTPASSLPYSAPSPGIFNVAEGGYLQPPLPPPPSMEPGMLRIMAKGAMATPLPADMIQPSIDGGGRGRNRGGGSRSRGGKKAGGRSEGAGGPEAASTPGGGGRGQPRGGNNQRNSQPSSSGGKKNKVFVPKPSHGETNPTAPPLPTVRSTPHMNASLIEWTGIGLTRITLWKIAS
ncbi:hypothetical protein H310_07700 [Aphanomyces invadans]|uniref:UPF3 domain-containing protein n=1 Tax=Aphanomyces invadans TaxID=157072 RepID=A0A024U3Y7_9STRA|nr:hypothetical protein H310_07700 [Aphanomyces invadans]ETW00333.1 hypothetical protein H310_07700 [Aphanomyces invadans]|eukprot:XP_008871358.1 hypothetical protein H310_07700 [Aphanomyces invadans]